MLSSCRYNVCSTASHLPDRGNTGSRHLAPSRSGSMMPSISVPHMLLRNPIARDMGEEAKSSTALFKLDW